MAGGKGIAIGRGFQTHSHVMNSGSENSERALLQLRRRPAPSARLMEELGRLPGVCHSSVPSASPIFLLATDSKNVLLALPMHSRHHSTVHPLPAML